MSNLERIKNATSQPVGDGLAVTLPSEDSYVLNPTSALVWNNCDGQTTQEQLGELLARQFNLTAAQAGALVLLTRDELDCAGLLEGSDDRSPSLVEPPEGVGGALLPQVIEQMVDFCRTTAP
jgi:hypothetical protein